MNDNYTMSLYEIINNFYTRAEVESWFTDYELSDYLTQDQIDVVTQNGRWTKQKLARKIVDHYLMEQIGSETMALFKHRAKIEMQEVMEKYLPLIYSRAIEYDPLVNVDYTESFTRNIERENTGSTEVTTSGSSNSESSNNSSGLNVGSDTPMTNLNKQDILAGNYASSTSANENEASITDETTTSSSNSGESSGNENVDETYTKRVRGNSGVSATAQKMVEQFRENIIAIDKDIIKEIEPLFMIIY